LPAFVKGEFKKLDEKAKNLPNLEEMMDGLQALDVRLLVCELGLGVHDLRMDDLIEGLEVVGATTFVSEAIGADLSFSF